MAGVVQSADRYGKGRDEGEQGIEGVVELPGGFPVRNVQDEAVECIKGYGY